MTVVDSGPTNTPMTTHAPNLKRAGYPLPAESFLNSLVDLYSKYAVASDSAAISVENELVSFLGFHKPVSTSSGYAASVTAALEAITDGGEGQLDRFTRAASKPMSDIIADNYYTISRQFQGYDTVTYRSLTAFLSIWEGLDPAERESFTHYNTYAATWAHAAWAQRDIVTTAGFTTWWKPAYWQNQVHSLATIDSGMAQIYWTKNNVVEGFTPTTSAETGHKSGSSSSVTSITTLEQEAWSRAVSALSAASGTAAVAAFTSLNTYSTDGSAGGGSMTTTLEEQAYLSSVSSLSAASSTAALESFTSLNTYTTADQGGQENNNGASNDGNQQIGVGTGLPHCPTYTPSVGPKYISCGGPAPAEATSVQAMTECTLGACTAMVAPYDKTKS